MLIQKLKWYYIISIAVGNLFIAHGEGLAFNTESGKSHVKKSTENSIYVNDMEYVLGDVKQAFIQNKVTTEDAADNLIAGFKKMKVNGIRVPIFADGLCPDKAMFDYFYENAVAEGFLIFANPAQSSGGQRIANGILNGAVKPVKDDPVQTNILINRIKDFANEYPCKWINPFNEDGRPDAAWSTNQINTIYQSLEDRVSGAELIGSCVWGLPAGILLMKNTDIAQYITVATTHNLGFNHTKWAEFIALAKNENLPVWDSETNNHDKYGTGTRIDAAISAGVDGLVYYDSWNTISLGTGEINSGGIEVMSKFLKSVTPLTYKANEKRSMSHHKVYTINHAGILEIQARNPQSFITLTTPLGKVVYTSSINQTLFLNLKQQNISNGVYFVNVSSPKGVACSKFLFTR